MCLFFNREKEGKSRGVFVSRVVEILESVTFFNWLIKNRHRILSKGKQSEMCVQLSVFLLWLQSTFVHFLINFRETFRSNCNLRKCFSEKLFITPEIQ